jgi:hypothetical protein
MIAALRRLRRCSPRITPPPSMVASPRLRARAMPAAAESTLRAPPACAMSIAASPRRSRAANQQRPDAPIPSRDRASQDGRARPPLAARQLARTRSSGPALTRRPSRPVCAAGRDDARFSAASSSSPLRRDQAFIPSCLFRGSSAFSTRVSRLGDVSLGTCDFSATPEGPRMFPGLGTYAGGGLTISRPDAMLSPRCDGFLRLCPTLATASAPPCGRPGISPPRCEETSRRPRGPGCEIGPQGALAPSFLVFDP